MGCSCWLKRKLVEQHQVRASKFLIPCIIWIFLVICVCFDHHRVNTDFLFLKKLLIECRIESISMTQGIIVKFEGKHVYIHDLISKALIKSSSISTLKMINYDSTLGEDTIIFQNGVTNAYNIRIHGGDIILSSWLGFKKNIHVNCAGLVQEGQYPKD